MSLGGQLMKINSVGSICSGVEAASVAWKPLGMEFKWFSEIAEFPSKVLAYRYPEIPNLGDMNDIPEKLLNNEIHTPDLICGGTPCQAFSLAGWKQGLNDERGNLTLKFVDIVEANDKVRRLQGLDPSVVFWENVEGVLVDKTNAFGSMISALAGLDDAIDKRRWPKAGILKGPKRNIAWRVIDAKYFGLPQQRKRLYLLAGGKNFHPENILFEKSENSSYEFPKNELVFEKNGHKFEVFREYTDCLYAAYGTKWNGNAAAYNGSLFVVQDDEIRRLSPLECERLMGFPDYYTLIPGAKKTSRYRAVGNSWAVPVIKWIGKRILEYSGDEFDITNKRVELLTRIEDIDIDSVFVDFSKGTICIDENTCINSTDKPEKFLSSDMKDFVSHEDLNKIHLSPVGTYGILRRKHERNINMNKRLQEVLTEHSKKMSPEEIEKRSKVQKRGKFSEQDNKEIQNVLLNVTS